VVDYALWGGLVTNNVEALEGLQQAGAIGYKAFMIETGTEFARADDGVLWDGMARIARWDAVLGVHAESNDIAIQLRARLEGAGRPLGPGARCARRRRCRAAVAGRWRQASDGRSACSGCDHSPCPAEEKARGGVDIRAAWGGSTGVQTLLPLMLCEGVRRRG